MDIFSQRNPNSPGLRFRLAAIAGVFLALGLVPRAQADSTDVAVVSVNKAQLYQQTGPANPAPRTNPFTFKAAVLPSRPNSISNAQIMAPGGPLQNMTGDGQGTFIFEGGNFTTVTGLDSAFPNGLYNFQLQTVTPPTAFAPSVNLGGNNYPTTVPRITNSQWASGALQINPTQNFNFTFDAFAGFNNGVSEIIFQIVDASNNLVFSRSLTTSSTNILMPKDTLVQDQYYTAGLIFANRLLATNGSTVLRPVYLIQTDFKIATISGPPVLSSPVSIQANIGQLFVYQVVASNHPVSYGTSPLPPGLTFNSTLGVITGVPASTGTTQVLLSATNGNGTGFASVSIEVARPFGPAIVSTTSALGYTGQPFKFQVVSEGATPAARLSATGLPPGLSVDPVTGLISGATNSVGSFLVSLSLDDQGSFDATASLQLTFTADPDYPVITNADTVIVRRGQFFTYTIATPGANDPLDRPTFGFVGTLPPGLSFDANTATISGFHNGNAPARIAQPDRVNLSGGALLGSIQLFGTNSHGTSTFQLLFLAPPSGAVNISTRILVGRNENVLIGGFIVTGNAPKVVIIRAIGPSIGIPSALQDPTLELHSGSDVVFNDNWKTGTPNQEQIIKDTTIPPIDDRESALVIGLDPGSYTAIVSGKDGATGIALVEVYDLGTASMDTGSKAQLAQISTRGNVMTGDDVMIGGFIVSGLTTKILVRAIGPELTAFGIGNALQDTLLELRNSNGAVVRQNDDWRSDQEQAIIDTSVPPTDNRESALVENLAPGAFTAIVRGKDNTTGVALVEVYSLP